MKSRMTGRLGGFAAVGLVMIGLSNLSAAPGDEHWDAEFGVPGADGPIRAVLVHSNSVFVSGRFAEIGDIAANNIAVWDRVSWHSLGEGLTGGLSVRALAIIGNELYAGGVFTHAGGAPARNIAKWNGTEWAAVNSGVNGIVRALAVDSGKLYVGGSFTEAGGVNAANIAVWDGNAWSALGSGIAGEAVDSLAVSSDGALYAGGRFGIAGGISARNIARWDGTNWSALGLGLRNSDAAPGGDSSAVRALCAVGDELYAGGWFRIAGGIRATNIAKWNGTGWEALGQGMGSEGNVWSLVRNGDEIYAGGSFVEPFNQVARWNGINWSPLGSGVADVFVLPRAAVWGMASNGSELFVGGFFTLAGGKPSSYIALWHIPHSLDVSRAVDEVTITWPATGTNFVLESSPLLAPGNWTELETTPLPNDDVLSVTQPATEENQFYRLRRKPW